MFCTAYLQAVEKHLQKGKAIGFLFNQMVELRTKCKKVKRLLCICCSEFGEERSDAKSVSLNQFITEYRFVCTMILLCDALPHVTHLSKCFQMSDCDYSIIPSVSIYNYFPAAA